MDWKSHAIIGTILAAIVFYLLNVSLLSLVFLAIFSGFSALLPDIDHKMGKARSLADKAFVVFALIYSFISCGISCDLVYFIKTALLLIGIYFLIITFLMPRHRGITHSLLFAFLYALVLYFLINFNLALAGFVGYASHLLADKEIKLL